MTKMTTANLFLFTVYVLMFNCGDNAIDKESNRESEEKSNVLNYPSPYLIGIDNIVPKGTCNNMKVILKNNEYDDITFWEFSPSGRSNKSGLADKNHTLIVQDINSLKGKFFHLYLQFAPYGRDVKRAKKRIGRATSFTYRVYLDDSLFFKKTITLKASYAITKGVYAYHPWVLTMDELVVNNQDYVAKVDKKNAYIKLAF